MHRPLLLALWLIAALWPLAAKAQSSQQTYADLAGQADSAIACADWQLAAQLLTKAMNLRPADPNNVLLMSNLGVVRHRMGDLDGALDVLSAANSLAPNSVTVLSNRARVLLAMDRKQEAASDYARVIALDPKVVDPYFFIGMIELGEGKLEEASRHFATLDSIAPDTELALLASATLLTAKSQLSQSAEIYRTLIKRFPAEDYYASLAQNLIALDRLSEASEVLSEAIATYPADPNFFMLRALVNKRCYRYDDARADARRAVELGMPKATVNSLLNSD